MSGPFDDRNGWRLYQHPASRDTFDKLVNEVADLKRAQPEAYTSHPKTKLLKRLLDVILVDIPRDPSAPGYTPGNTLDSTYRHWRRAKFLGRFRLFFRYSSAQKSIIYAWINDENTVRKASAHTDPYAVFAHRLRTGHPPDDWDTLMMECLADGAPQKSDTTL